MLDCLVFWRFGGSLFVCLSVCLFVVCLSVCLFVCLFVCLCVCLSVFVCLFAFGSHFNEPLHGIEQTRNISFMFIFLKCRKVFELGVLTTSPNKDPKQKQTPNQQAKNQPTQRNQSSQQQF